MLNHRIAFIGSGVMAGAMIVGLIRQRVASAENLVAADPLTDRLEELERLYHIKGVTSNQTAVKGADVVVLSIKPQKIEAVLKDLRGKIEPNALVLSIVAGASMDKIVAGLEHPYVVRAMPNTPAQIGEGITVWVATPSVSPQQLETTREILGAFGEEVFVDEEDFLNAATALSGTGPAYVFLFMEAMVDAGVHLGFSRRIAEKLVSQTVRGAVDYYLRSLENGTNLHLAHLRNQVTSPAGTAAAALYYLEKAGFRTALSRAIWAAYERSRALGMGKDTHPPDSD